MTSTSEIAKWSKKMEKFAETLEPSTDKAQAWNISTKLKTVNLPEFTIAQMMINDHYDISHSLRHSRLLVRAGLAVYIKNQFDPSASYGQYEFIDGSILTTYSPTYIKFKGHDSGNCRVYGTYNRKLYCIMDGQHNYGFMGLFECSKDGEPSHQLSLSPYRFAGIDKEVIETVPIRSPEGWGDKQLMKILGREHGVWEY